MSTESEGFTDQGDPVASRLASALEAGGETGRAEALAVPSPPVAAALDPAEVARLRAVAAGGAREVKRAIAEAVSAEKARAEAAERKLAVLEGALTWGTSCLSCSRILDSAYAETVRREKAEATVRQIAGCTREWKLLVGDDPEALADAILAIIGTEEQAGNGNV